MLITLWSLTIPCCSATSFLKLSRERMCLVTPTSFPPVLVVVCFEVPLLRDTWSQYPDHMWLLKALHQLETGNLEKLSNCKKGSYFLFLCRTVLSYIPIELQQPRGISRWMYNSKLSRTALLKSSQLSIANCFKSCWKIG